LGHEVHRSIHPVLHLGRSHVRPDPLSEVVRLVVEALRQASGLHDLPVRSLHRQVLSLGQDSQAVVLPDLVAREALLPRLRLLQLDEHPILREALPEELDDIRAEISQAPLLERVRDQFECVLVVLSHHTLFPNDSPRDRSRSDAAVFALSVFFQRTSLRSSRPNSDRVIVRCFPSFAVKSRAFFTRLLFTVTDSGLTSRISDISWMNGDAMSYTVSPCSIRSARWAYLLFADSFTREMTSWTVVDPRTMFDTARLIVLSVHMMP